MGGASTSVGKGANAKITRHANKMGWTGSKRKNMVRAIKRNRNKLIKLGPKMRKKGSVTALAIKSTGSNGKFNGNAALSTAGKQARRNRKAGEKRAKHTGRGRTRTPKQKKAQKDLQGMGVG